MKYNGAGLQSDKPMQINNANLIFSKNNSFLNKWIPLSVESFDPKAWGSNGQASFRRIAEKICNVSLEKLPIIDLGYAVISLPQGLSLAITPETLNYLGGNTFETSGYTATIGDVRTMQTFEGVGINTPASTTLNTTTTLGTSVSKTVVGTTINLRATTVNTLFGTNTALYTTLTVVGRDSGARLSIPVTVTKV